MYISILLCVTMILGCQDVAQSTWNADNNRPKTATETVSTSIADTVPVKTEVIPEGARRIIDAYPDFNLRYENNKIIFTDGYAVIYDDGKKKTFVQKLDDSDIEDSFAMPYQTSGTPAYQADGGRSRSDEFFKKMYGSSAAQVQRNLTTINWFGTRVKVTKINGVDKKLQAVANELARYPHLKKYLIKPQTFYWRKVRGSNRQSAHSYGIAIDMGISYSNYWQWLYKTTDENAKIQYKNRFPEDIARIFEKHGFIWGGRWYHFDTMHFEYRPEILNQ